MTMGYKEIKKAIAEGKALEMRKYRRFGEWGNWKPVSAEKALRKMEITVYDYDEDGIVQSSDCPYDFRLAEVG